MKHKNINIHIHEDDLRNLCSTLVATIMTRHSHGYIDAQRLLSQAILQGGSSDALAANENLINSLKDTIQELESNSKSLEEIENAPKPLMNPEASATNT